MNILIVDDEIALQEILGCEFQSKGLKVFLADNGETALDVLEREKIDLVLSDVRMPVMDGLQFLVVARHKFGSNLPIYFMTGYDPYLPHELEEAGASGIFKKPVYFDLMWAQIQKIKH